MCETNNNDKLESLTIRRVIPAPPGRVFSAWTEPAELEKWWGPKGVRCLSAEIDLRVGGRYRIANEMPDRSVIWIAGEFEAVDRPNFLTYLWCVEGGSPTLERVHVSFDAHEEGTEVNLRHERISTTTLRDQHQQGWQGCFDGLVHYLTDRS